MLDAGSMTIFTGPGSFHLYTWGRNKSDTLQTGFIKTSDKRIKPPPPPIIYDCDRQTHILRWAPVRAGNQKVKFVSGAFTKYSRQV